MTKKSPGFEDWAWAQEVGGVDKLVLLVIAKRANWDNGDAYPSQAYIAKMCGISERSVRDVLKRLEEAGVIKRRPGGRTANGRLADIITILAPLCDPEDTVDPNRQNPSDRNRQNSQRNRQNSSPITANLAAQPSLTSQEQEPPSEDAREASPKKEKMRQARRLTEDWTLSSEGRDYARKLGFADSRIDLIAENFRDYWIAKAGEAARKTDWEATWRGWIRREAERLPAARRGSGPSRGPQIEGGLF